MSAGVRMKTPGSRALRAEYRQLFDSRAATPTDIKSNEVESLLSKAPFHSKSRRAYVVAPGVGYGMGRVAQAMAEYQGIEFELFFDLPEARQWLLGGNSSKDNAKSS